MVFFRRRGKPQGLINFIEYIQSSGSQYIQTGFTANQDTRLKMKFQIVGSQSGHNWLYGSRISGSSSSFGFFWNYSAEKFGGSYGKNQVDISNEVGENDLVSVDHNKNVLTFNSVQYIFPVQTFTTPVPLPLLVRSTNGTLAAYSHAKLYYCQIYDDGNLVRDYLPALDPDGTACLYDSVNKEFVYNAGSGEFVAGPEL